MTGYGSAQRSRNVPGRPRIDHLTEPLATTLAEQTLTRGVGRPSLTAPGEQSPQLAFRVPVELNERVRVRAAAEGKRTSDIIREALEHYV